VIRDASTTNHRNATQADSDAHREIDRLTAEAARLSSTVDHLSALNAELTSTLAACGYVFAEYMALQPDATSPEHERVLGIMREAEGVMERALRGEGEVIG
jgi:hypothetical protein